MLASGFAPGSAVAAALAIGRWAGTYQGSMTLTIGNDGRFTWEQTRVFGFGDVTTTVRGQGTARRNANSLRIVFDPRLFEPKLPAEIELPSSYDFDLVEYDGMRLLLDKLEALNIINNINRFGRSSREVNVLVRKTATLSRGGEPHFAYDPAAILPKHYRSLLLDRPVEGVVIAVGPVAEEQIYVGGWMQPQTPAIQHSARATLNVGRAQRVFVGMAMFLGPLRLDVVVDRLDEDSSECLVTWLAVGAPAVGQGVSSFAIS